MRHNEIINIKPFNTEFILVPLGIEGLPVCARESDDATRFIVESTLTTINEVITPVDAGSTGGSLSPSKNIRDIDRILMPPPSTAVDDNSAGGQIPQPQAWIQSSSQSGELSEELDDGELDLDGIDDNEIDAYLMTKEEAQKKKETWEKINADYIQQQKRKQTNSLWTVLETHTYHDCTSNNH